MDLLPILIAGTFDFFFKEVKKRKVGYENIPWILHHPQWIFVCLTVWFISCIGVYVFTESYVVFYSTIIYFLGEDLIYYLWTYLFYQDFIPKKIGWLWFIKNRTDFFFFLAIELIVYGVVLWIL
jgi:hypothetical protein